MFRLVPDLTGYPEIVWLHRRVYVPGVVIICVTWILGGFGVFAIGYCRACLAVVHAGSAVNYFGHKRWTRRYKTADNSANTPLIALISLGEGWHNNHHYYRVRCCIHGARCLVVLIRFVRRRELHLARRNQQPASNGNLASIVPESWMGRPFATTQPRLRRPRRLRQPEHPHAAPASPAFTP